MDKQRILQAFDKIIDSAHDISKTSNHPKPTGIYKALFGWRQKYIRSGEVNWRCVQILALHVRFFQRTRTWPKETAFPNVKATTPKQALMIR